MIHIVSRKAALAQHAVRMPRRVKRFSCDGRWFTWRAGCAIAVLALWSHSGFGAHSAASADIAGSVVMPAKVRDFKGYNIGGHPDFQNQQGFQPNAVFDKIDTAGLRSSFEHDNRNPKLRSTRGPFTTFDNFSQWYNDADTSINRPFLIGLRFSVHEDCKLTYYNNSFFPIDRDKDYYSLSNPPIEPFGHLQPGNPQHNYGFTMEFHTTFTYVRGEGQVFKFTGDDDVWVFINDSLVIDLGGTHTAKSASVNLDDLPRGFLRDGKKYMLDFFSAERHTVASTIRIETSILFDLGFEEGIFVKRRAAAKMIECYGQMVEVPQDQTLQPPTTQVVRPPDAYGVAPGVWVRDGAVRFEPAAYAPPSARLHAVDGRMVEIHPVNGRAVLAPSLPAGVYVLMFERSGRTFSKSLCIVR
jgi:fibro-slime domain-containing protein